MRTREADTDTPTTTTTRPLYVGTGYEAWRQPTHCATTSTGRGRRRWTAHTPRCPDFTRSAAGPRCCSVRWGSWCSPVGHRRDHCGPPVLGAHRAGAGSRAAVTSAVAPSLATPTPSAPVPAAPPPAYSSVTATASTVVAPPPPVMQPGEPQPKPGVRQRLRDLFPRLFPGQ